MPCPESNIQDNMTGSGENMREFEAAADEWEQVVWWQWCSAVGAGATCQVV
jgi:hypothetical protein